VIIEYLIINESGVYFDGTLGGGGHSSEILNHLGKEGKIIGVDVETDAIKYSHSLIKNKKEKRLIIRKENYCNFKKLLTEFNYKYFDGMLLDLGISSYQLDNPTRGFSYMKNYFLDMRMDPEIKTNAYDVINFYPEEELVRIFRDYSETKFFQKLVKTIVKFRAKRPIRTTFDLLEIVKKFTSKEKLYSTASKIFQALRIEVNNELENLKDFLENFVNYLRPGGRICIISYHSLEDRLVKEAFKRYEKGCICPSEFPVCRCGRKKELNIITKKPFRPGKNELMQNPRARSARLRIAERTN